MRFLKTALMFWLLAAAVVAPANAADLQWYYSRSDASVTTRAAHVNTNTSAVSYTGAISGTSLSVSGVSGGSVAVGQGVTGTGVDPETVIVSGSGSSWVVSISQTVASTTMKSFQPLCPFGMRYFPNPFGQDVEIVGIKVYISDWLAAGSGAPFLMYQRGSDWAFIAGTETQQPSPSATTSALKIKDLEMKYPVFLAAGDTILEESACTSGSGRSLGATITARTVP